MLTQLTISKGDSPMNEGVKTLSLFEVGDGCSWFDIELSLIKASASY